MGRARIADTDKLKELNAGIPRETDEHLSERCIDSLVPGAEHVGVVTRLYRRDRKMLVAWALVLRDREQVVVAGQMLLPVERVEELPSADVPDEIVDACKEATNFYMDTLREEADFLEQGMSEIKQLTGEADGGSSS
jgi:hypothetical protein